MVNFMERQAGVLCPVFCMPANQGIGDFGLKTEKFMQHVVDAGYKIWQILPLQMTGDSHSPYQTLSSFAGDPIYINLDRLCEMGLLTQSSIVNCNKFKNFVDYDTVRSFKEKYFLRAFKAFKKNYATYQADFEAFQQEAFWLQDWVHFSLFRQLHDNQLWSQWDEEYRNWENGVDLSEYKDDMLYIQFLQFIFYKQWDALRDFAHSISLKIMGDIPFYVDLNSSDVWSHQSDFLLDEKGNPNFVAGCPPDYFSEDGQRWGMPIYNFEHQKKNGYAFWCSRMQWMNRCYDTVRIDHFRAYDTYWKIPASCPTAVEGEWIEAPGRELLDAIYNTSAIH